MKSERLLSLGLTLAAWELFARLVPTRVLPPFSQVMRALALMVQAGDFSSTLPISLGNLAIGLTAAVFCGIAAGCAMARWRVVDVILDPYITACIATPSLLFVPVLFTLFGVSRLTQIGAVFLAAVFVMTASTRAGLQHASPSLLAMASAFGASPRQLFWKVRWPEARPLVMSGLRVSAVLGVKGMINGEMFIAFTGLGALIRTYGGRFEPDKVLAVLLVIVAISFATTSAVDAVGGRRR